MDPGRARQRGGRPPGRPRFRGDRVSLTRIEPARRLRGELRPPTDKSLSHRAAILGAMSSTTVRVRGYLDAEDTNSTLRAVQQLGARVETAGDDLLVHGVGLRWAVEPDAPIDVGNAGTLMRLLPGWLAAQDGRSFTLDGDASIRRRPVDRIAEPLTRMGAAVAATDGRLPPFIVTGARLRAIGYEMPVASAQVKSCVLLAALGADGASTVTEPALSRDHTERMLAAAGVDVRRHGRDVTVAGVDELALDALVVPGDASSAAFAIAAGLIVPGSQVRLRGVGVNWTRCGFVRIVQRMGGIVAGELEDAPGEEVAADEPLSDLEVTAGPLVGTVVEPDEVPLAIDELPLVALLGCFAEGETVVRGAQELRLKESDRIATVVEGLRALGGEIEATEDGFVVTGTGGLRGGRIGSHGDHRLAMLGAVAGLASREGVEVEGMEAAEVSYPRFLHDMATLM
ncbi:MAG TPA: 3-phosphoshikimate 1-carboxyvinyltransferase [Solirubrobacteraceae bacterium]